MEAQVEQFQSLVSKLTGDIEGRPLSAELQDYLNRQHGPGSATYEALAEACKAGAREGWLCNREGGGIRYGRVIKPGTATRGFSVDVVDMQDIKGPHHTHPNGEIDLVIPLTAGARFDGHPAGWAVYEAGSAHYPTVSEGRALVLYLLPQGAIQFTPQ
ncbi:MAG: 2-hydroxylaminobenzoate mutase [Paucimonas sp.]|nr:2-hydroxylaminobenzoate mutase [Paucimonas sp.]